MLNILLAVALLLQILDGITTYKALAGNKGKEGNPIMAWIFDKLGVKLGLLLTKGAGLVLSYWAWSIGAIPLLVIIAVIYAYVVYNNYKIIMK